MGDTEECIQSTKLGAKEKIEFGVGVVTGVFFKVGGWDGGRLVCMAVWGITFRLVG